MKILLIALTFFNLQAQTRNFVCESETSRFQNLFTLEGSIETAGVVSSQFIDNHLKATTLLKPQVSGGSVVLIENIDQMAKVKKIAGQGNKKFFYINMKLKAQEQNLEYKIYLDYPAKYNSIIKNLETKQSYRAFCKLI